ncbi:hypothetical protein GGI07_004228 [Coemansia sp. Benny D115]|nr:hypothetical protein GGI07_004228 [Coemansia sp. Benny D115]
MSLLDRADAWVHAVFDPLHLSGVGEYWQTMALSLIVHIAYFKAVPFASRLLLPQVYNNMSKQEKRSWEISFTGLAHAIFDSWFILTYFNSVALNSDKMDGYDKGFEYLLAWAHGYYVWDLTICLTDFKNYGVSYVIHGALGAFGLLVLTSRQLQFYAIPYLLPELSSVFLNIRHILKCSGLTDTLLYKVNFVMFLLAFVVVRIGFEAYHSLLLIGTVYRGETGNVYYPYAVYFAILGVTLTALNIMWLKQILVAAYYTLSGKSSKAKNKKTQ